MTVRIVDARDLTTYGAFRAVSDATEPLLLRGAPLQERGQFTTATLVSELSNLHVPERSSRTFFVGDQGSADVMDPSAKAWHPSGLTFGGLMAALSATGSSLYLSMRTAARACRRCEGKIVYDKETCKDGSDTLLQELIARAPVPLILPEEEDHIMVFWIGSRGKNFGLHTDLYTDQFLVQTQGTKEVYLLLPEDASTVAPFPFVISEKFYKSQLRSVTHLNLKGSGCLRATLQPGDILYIPAFWWHELRTVSDGLSLTTTFRVHLEEKEKFYGAVDAIYKLCKSAREKGNERLAKHISSYFAHGAMAGPSGHGTMSTTATFGIAVACFAAGFLVARFGQRDQ